MKSFIQCAFPAVVAACGLVGVHGSAMAARTEHGTICKPSGNSNTGGLQASINGAFNYSGVTMDVVCPVVRVADVPTSGTSV